MMKGMKEMKMKEGLRGRGGHGQQQAGAAADVTNDVSDSRNKQYVGRSKRSDEHDAADGKGSFDDE